MCDMSLTGDVSSREMIMRRESDESKRDVWFDPFSVFERARSLVHWHPDNFRTPSFSL